MKFYDTINPTIKLRFALFSFLFLIGIFTNAQVIDESGNSPYSQIGIGDINSIAFSRNMGMGNVGVANGASNYINLINPALLSLNKQTVYEFGASANFRQSISKNVGVSNTFGGNLNHIALAFNISKKNTISIAYLPYSKIKYRYESKSNIQNDTNVVDFSNAGSGNITQLAFAWGYEIDPNFAFGAKVSYIFGNVWDETNVKLGNLILKTVLTERNFVNGMEFSPGFVAKTKVFNNNKYLRFGATYRAVLPFAGSKDQFFQERNLSDRVGKVDTVFANKKFTPELPSFLSFGTSLYSGEKWSLAADLDFGFWTGVSFRTFAPNQSLQNQVTLKVGGEYTPIYEGKKGYFNSVSYRAGFQIGQTPYLINGNGVNEYSASLGFGFPISKLSSLLNTTFIYGYRTNITTSSGIQEHFVNINLGVNITDRWFIRPKYD